MRVLQNKLSALACACILALSLPLTAYAATSYSPVVSGGVSGKSYTVQAICSTSGVTATVQGIVTCKSGTAEAEWMGANAMLMTASGGIARYASSFNPYATTTYSVYVEDSRYSSYYGKVYGNAWNPSTGSYANFGTATTGTLSTRSALIIAPCQTNSQGLTYGSIFSISEDCSILPDMILVVGVNGENGYVYTTDWRAAQASNPAEAEAFVAQGTVTLPVYDCEGMAQIDEFIITYSGEVA